jgi:PAS domain S-box-containing protein
MDPNSAVVFYIFLLAPLLALVVSLLGSIPVVIEVGERWLLVLLGVLVVMIASQVLELIAYLQTGVIPGTTGGEFVETGANLLTAGAVYYVLSVTRDRKVLSEQLAVEERRHETLFEQSPSPILVVRDGVITEANPQAEDYFDCVETVEGRSVTDFVAGEADDSLRERSRRVADTGDPEHVPELPLRTCSGEDRLASVLVGPAEFAEDDAVEITFRDLTEHREISAELAGVRDRLEETFRNTNDAILILDPDPDADRILECNRTACELLGYDREELLACGPFDVYPEDSDTLRVFMDTVVEEDGYVTDELDCYTADGDVVPSEVSGSVTTFADRQALLTIIRDISDRRQRERRIRVMSRLLRHNLRNDMNVVLGHLEQLREAAPPEAHEHADRIEAVVDGLVDLSGEVQIAQDTLEDPTVTVMDAETLLRNAVAACRESYPDAEPEITVEAPDKLDIRANQLLEVALRHLVANAIEHNDSEPPRVRLTVEQDEDGAVSFTVADNGPGIPDIDRRVVTGDTEITAVEHVDGFGLWVVAWVTDTLGGRISFAENDPRGTVVDLWVPDAAEPSIDTEEIISPERDDD